MATLSSRPATVYSAPALEKGLDILEVLASTEVPQSLSDLANTLGRTGSELFRVLNALEKRSYVVKDSTSGRYHLSLKLYELAHIHPPVEQLLRSAGKPMRDLAYSHHQSCHLSVLSQGGLVVLAEAGSPGPIRLAIAVGSSFSAIHTASGRLLLACLPEEERKRFLEKDPAYRKQSRIQREKLQVALDSIREAGYSTAENETYVGIRDVAVPVGNTRIGVAAALDMTLWIHPDERFKITKVLEPLRKCARIMTRSMGVTQR